MTTAILITQCMQRDFVGLLQPHEPLPNALHVGRDEAIRLLGDDPQTGPLSQLRQWARAQDVDTLHIIHVRDWHDPKDPEQRRHLEHFGLHCIQGTPGAELVLAQGHETRRANEYLVNSTTLNDFTGGAELEALLRDITQGQPVSQVRIGVVGVWTEAKVTFLLYELMTRCRFTQLATCSALTASASRSQHFIALEQLRKILGVQVFNSVGDFAAWLVPNGAPVSLPKAERGMRPLVDCGSCALEDDDLEVLAYLYRNSATVEIKPLTGGFSGAGVFRVVSYDALGHSQAAAVVKLGPRDLIATERVAFEQVESILGNDAPTLRGSVELAGRAGIKFAYAGMGNGDVRTLKSLYESDAAQERIDFILRQVFGDILKRFHVAAKYETLPLLKYYTFDPAAAEGVRNRIVGLVGEDASRQKTLRFPGEYEVRNVAEFYASDLADISQPAGECHFVSYVHGDLNAANILIDDRDNVWLVDFFHTHRGHILRDVAKLENDLLYILTRLECEADLVEALQITRALRCVKDLRAPLPKSLPGLTRPQLARAWRTLVTLREIVADICQEDRDPRQLTIAQLRYAVHTLGFDESNRWQRLWALAAAGGYADDLARAARENRELRIDWLPESLTQRLGARVGLTICPGRRDRGRNLEADLAAVKASGASRLVSLLTQDELDWAGVSQIRERAADYGLEPKLAPINDQDAPTPEQMDELATWMEEGLRRGRDTVLHCLGGLGRSGTVAACLLSRHGVDAESAIRAVREARGPRAVETDCQEMFIRDYAGEQTRSLA